MRYTNGRQNLWLPINDKNNTNVNLKMNHVKHQLSQQDFNNKFCYDTDNNRMVYLAIIDTNNI